MGYVGAVCSACLSELGYKIVGVDVNTDKIQMINNGKSPIVEEGLQEMIRSGVSSGRIIATTDTGFAIKTTQISMICVGTPSKHSGDLDLCYVQRVCEEIGEQLKNKDEYHLVILRSTVLPGTCKNIVRKTLERTSGKKVGTDFGIAMNPEFLRESTAINDFFYPPMIVIGANDKKSGDIAEQLYEAIDAPIIRKSIEVAELIKYSCNVWHATKVSFANEIGSIAKAVGVDGREVMDAVCQDKKLNVSPYYMKPAFSFGGSCLPKDVRALSYRSRQLDLSTPLIESLMPSNKAQLMRGYDLITKTGKKKIALLGLSFKSGTDDLRESPFVEMVEMLIGKGYDIAIYDENIEYAKVHGANKDYINLHIPHISTLLNPNYDEVIAHADVIAIGNGSNEFKNIVKNVPDNKHVVDLYGVMEGSSETNIQGICW